MKIMVDFWCGHHSICDVSWLLLDWSVVVEFNVVGRDQLTVAGSLEYACSYDTINMLSY